MMIYMVLSVASAACCGGGDLNFLGDSWRWGGVLVVYGLAKNRTCITSVSSVKQVKNFTGQQSAVSF